MKSIVVALSFLLFLMSCSKKENVTESNQSSQNELVETATEVIDSTIHPQSEEPIVSEENALPKSGNFISDDREISVKFEIDERKEQIATISEKGKENVELYQNINQPKTFEDRSIGVWFTLRDEGLELTESTKVSQFKRK